MAIEDPRQKDREDFLLSECYDLAARFETDPAAKRVLRERAGRINAPAGAFPARTEASRPESPMETVSKAMLELSRESAAAPDLSAFPYASRIAGLPNSAEKEYVLALLALRAGTGKSQRTEALRHLRAALEESPSDPRYLALAAVLREAGR